MQGSQIDFLRQLVSIPSSRHGGGEGVCSVPIQAGGAGIRSRWNVSTWANFNRRPVIIIRIAIMASLTVWVAGLRGARQSRPRQL